MKMYLLLCLIAVPAFAYAEEKKACENLNQEAISEYQRRVDAYNEQVRKAAEQQNETERQIKYSAELQNITAEQLKKSEEQGKKMEKLIDRWERQADRYDALLSKWEGQEKLKSK